MTLISENIRYLRKLNGLTQEQFSRKINIKRSLLGAYEEARANPNQQNMQAIAKAFNTTVELLTRQDLRKLRETPTLSIPLGQPPLGQPSRSSDAGSQSERTSGNSSVRSDGKLVSGNDPFQHPDFPDIFAPAGPEPKPLASVLNKYYNPPEEPKRSAPQPPVITPPVHPGQTRPDSFRPDQERVTQPTTYPPASPAAGSDRSFRQPAQPSESLSFNNVYEDPAAANRQQQTVQSVAATIPVVMQRQFGEYGQRYQQADFLHRLPTMHLPTLPHDHYRAFEAGDDFTFPGALLVGKYIKNWFDIADGKLYILLINQQPTGAGVRCRRVYNQVKVKGSLLLTADRADTPTLEVLLKDVLEVWEVCAFMSQQLPPLAPNTDRLKQLVDELRFEVERL